MPSRADDPAVAAVQAMYDRLQAERVGPHAALNALLSCAAGLIVTTAEDAGDMAAMADDAVNILRDKIRGTAALGLLGAGLKGGGDGR
jgi:hypothetical protein